jgi:amidase
MTFPEYDRYDALGLAELVRSHQVAVPELLEEAISRAEALNPLLNAIVLPLYEMARRSASRERSEGPFAGVPFLLKDLLHAYAGVPLSSGSLGLRDYSPDQDSELVARFERAGLVVFGKTNVPEFGLVAITEPKAFGAARNPWDLTRSPGGSSGGSAAAVAAGIVPMASATDGGGSIRIPAGWTGIFGLKPSRGRTPSGPYHAEVWEGAVVEHVLTRSVRDSAAALDLAAAPARGDPYPRAQPARPYAAEVGARTRRLRIAFTARSPLGTAVDRECRAAVERTARLCEDLGHHVTEREAPIDGIAVARAYLTLYFGQVGADLRWIARNVGRKAARQVEDATRVLGSIGESISAAEYVEARASWNRFGRAMGGFHGRFDLYLTPTAARPPAPIGSLEGSPLVRIALKLVNRLRAGGAFRATGLLEKLALENLAPVPFTQLANLTGQPAMSVPLHWTPDGLPCGSQFVAPVGAEATLIRLAAQLEEASPWFDRRPAVRGGLRTPHELGSRAE